MFRLSRLTDYAVALLTRMASDDKMVWAAPDLADQSGLPLPTVSKILKQLAKTGVLRAQRGASGGYRLAHRPAVITVAMIVEAMDGPIAITDCADGGDHSCQIETVCPMSQNWNRINQAIRQALSSLNLSEMADGAAAQTATLPLTNKKTATLLVAAGETS
jgi:FeS assembly SUF system regulator